MKELNKKWLIFIAAVFAILWLGLMIRCYRFESQTNTLLKSLRACSITVIAQDADSGDTIPTALRGPIAGADKRLASQLRYIPASNNAMTIKCLIAKPTTFAVSSPGYREETIKIDEFSPEQITVKLKKLDTQ